MIFGDGSKLKTYCYVTWGMNIPLLAIGCSLSYCWLVVSFFPISYMGCHPSRTHIFQDGYCTTNQTGMGEIYELVWCSNGTNMGMTPVQRIEPTNLGSYLNHHESTTLGLYVGYVEIWVLHRQPLWEGKTWWTVGFLEDIAIAGWWFGIWILWLSIQLGTSSSQLTFTPSFVQRGRYTTSNQVGIWPGWWFGTFFILPYIEKNHPNRLSYFSEG